MSEKDFVLAWLLASRAGSDALAFTDNRVANCVHQARAIYKQLNEEEDETNG